MITIRLRSKISTEELDQKWGKILSDDDYNCLLTGPAKVQMPDGKPLLTYLPRALDEELLDSSYEVLHSLKSYETNNRGLASGSKRARLYGGVRTYSKPVASAIIGSFEKKAPFTYCRLTAWTGREMEKYASLFPLFRAIAGQFKAQVPDRFENQMEQVGKTPADWVIRGTPFSTITVNNCVDEETECLTRRLGWTRYDALRDDDEIMAYDPSTHTTRWEGLTGIFVNPAYNGEMVLLTSRGFSALTTPDHRWPLQAGYPGSFTVRTSESLPSSRYWRLPRSAPFVSTAPAIYTDAFVRLVAWYYTEGSLTSDGLKAIITQSDIANPEKVGRIRADIAEVGALPNEIWPIRCAEMGCATAAMARGLCQKHYNAARSTLLQKAVGEGGHRPRYSSGKGRRRGLWCREEVRSGIRKFHLFGDGLEELLHAAPGPAKVPTSEFLASLTPEQARMFVEVSIAADGYQAQNRFFQDNVARMSAFMEAAVLAGYSPTLDAKGTTASLRRRAPSIGTSTIARQRLMHLGPIWCPSVPSSHWVARRRGTIYVTGNTYPTGVHTDKGDLDQGYSCLATLRKGDYTGGRLVFPEYRVAVDMQHGDLLLMDAHQAHGNTALSLESEDAERISVVCYYRTKIATCDSMAAENQKAARQPQSVAV